METPFDCVYIPFLMSSGPVVYYLAHMAQHQADRIFTVDQVMISWNLVPGCVCLLLGGIQWVLIESCWLRHRKKIREETPGHPDP